MSSNVFVLVHAIIMKILMMNVFSYYELDLSSVGMEDQITGCATFMKLSR